MKKNSILYVALIGTALTCSSPKSEKGKWIEKDKEDFKKECMASYDKAKPEELNIMKQIGIADKADYAKVCDCALKNAEVMFLPEEIKNNEQELGNIATKCLVDFVGEKGAWKPSFKDFLKKAVLKQVEEIAKTQEISEEEKQTYNGLMECAVDKLEKEAAPIDFLKNPQSIDKSLEKTIEECGVELHVGMEVLKAVIEQNLNISE